MVVMFMIGVLTDKEHGLTIVSVHAMQQPALHEPVDSPIDGGKTDITTERSAQFIFDLLRRTGPFAGVQVFQQRAYNGSYPSATAAEYTQVFIQTFCCSRRHFPSLLSAGRKNIVQE